MEAAQYCECSNCSYYHVSDECPPPDTPSPTVTQTAFPTVLTVQVETSSASALMGSAVGSILFGIVAGYFIRGCMMTRFDEKTSSVVPMIERDLGSTSVSIDIENPISQQFTTNGDVGKQGTGFGKEDAISEAKSTTTTAPSTPPNEREAYTPAQKATLKGLTNFMTPSSKLKGAIKLRRVVKDRLLSLQKNEKAELLAKLEKLREAQDAELRAKEEAENQELAAANHDPRDAANLEKLRRQDLAYLKIRCVEHGRCVVKQLRYEQQNKVLQATLEKLEWFLSNNAPLNQSELTFMVDERENTNAMAMSLLKERISDQMKEEIDGLDARHQANWNVRFEDELKASKAQDAHYQQIVKEDLDEMESSMRENLRQIHVARKKIKEAELKLKKAPENEAKVSLKNLELLSRAQSKDMDADLHAVRASLLKLEEFMCADRGNVLNDTHLGEGLRQLFKKEIVALKTKLFIKKEREIVALNRKMSAKEHAKKKEFATYGNTKDGETEEEFNSEMKEMQELRESEINAIESNFSSSLEDVLKKEASRHSVLTAQGQTMFWEELVILKLKHNQDSDDLNAELVESKAEARAELDSRAKKEASILERNISSIHISTPAQETPGANRGRSETAMIAMAGFDNEKDRLHAQLEMTFGADRDRAVEAERQRQIKAEGSEEDFEHELANLKFSHEKEISFLANSLYAEQRRQRARLESRLHMRKKNRKADMEAQGCSQAEVDKSVVLLDEEFEKEELDLLRMTGLDIEKRLKIVRDTFAEEEKKAEDYHGMLQALRDEHDSSFAQLKQTTEDNRRRQRDLLKQRLAAQRAKKEAEKGGNSEEAQALLAQQEREEFSEFDYATERALQKLNNEENAKLGAAIMQLDGEKKASKGFYFKLNQDLASIMAEHADGITALEADMDMKNARQRKKLKDRLDKMKADKLTELNSVKATDVEKAAEMAQLREEMSAAADEQERSLLETEMKLKEKTLDILKDKTGALVSTATTISGMQADASDEARKLREDAAKSQLQLEAELKNTAGAKQKALKERLEAKRKKKEASLKKKGASDEELKRVEADLLAEEVSEYEKMEAEILDLRKKLESAEKEKETQRIAEMQMKENAAADNAAEEAKLAEEAARRKMEALKADHEQKAKKIEAEMEEQKSSQKAKLKRNLAKRRKDREKELDKKKASEEERLQAQKALKDEEERLQKELEQKLEMEKKEAEEAAKLAAEESEKELQRQADAAAAEAAAAVAKKQILEAAQKARVEAQKAAAEQQAEDEAAADEISKKRLLEKFQKEAEAADKEAADKKNQQKLKLKERIEMKKKNKLAKEQAARRKEAAVALKENKQKSVAQLEDLHSKQIEDLGEHLKKGSGEESGGAVDKEHTLMHNDELEALKKELAELKEEKEKHAEDAAEHAHELELMKHDEEVLKEDLKFEKDEREHEVKQKMEEQMALQEKIAEVTGELNATKLKLTEAMGATVPKNDYDVAVKELEEVKESNAMAQAQLKESKHTREELEGDKKDMEKKLKEKEKAVGALELKAIEREEEVVAAMVAKDGEREKAVEEARGELAVVVDRLEKEKAEVQLVADRVEGAESEAKENAEQRQKFENQYKVEIKLRKKYWNMLEDAKGKVRVYARIRPLSTKEAERGDESKVEIVDETSLALSMSFGGAGTPEERRVMPYDSVFGPNSTQLDIFDECQGMVLSCLDGYNACVFAYGQTGAGKTWTMSGNDEKRENWGLTRRFIEFLFSEIHDLEGTANVKVSCEFMEIYCNELRDMFYAMDNHGDSIAMKNKPKLDVKDLGKKGIIVKGVTEKIVSDSDEMMNLFNEANKYRVVTATAMNAESSRSHSVFTIKTELYNITTKQTHHGKLNIIDLAGSERTAKSEVTGQQLKEANEINKSLLALGGVIRKLSEPDGTVIDFRSSKLTHVMKDSLGGTAKTLMFVNLSPSADNVVETKGSLDFASNTKNITNTAEKSTDNAEVTVLKNEVKQLKKQLGV
jgi:hypothetical protein